MVQGVDVTFKLTAPGKFKLDQVSGARLQYSFAVESVCFMRDGTRLPSGRFTMFGVPLKCASWWYDCTHS